MDSATSNAQALSGNALNLLRQFARERVPQERCDVCSAVLSGEHAHLMEPGTRQLICVCDECLVSVGNRADGKYRRVPRSGRAIPDMQLDDALWESLMIPVGMAFFFYNSQAGKMAAFYPSPAGATEALLDLASWQDIAQANAALNYLEPDVQALLVNRIKGAHAYYIVGIDKCYELVGLIRSNWHGLSGGREVWQAIDAFFATLEKSSTNLQTEPQHA